MYTKGKEISWKSARETRAFDLREHKYVGRTNMCVNISQCSIVGAGGIGAKTHTYLIQCV